MEKLLSKLEWVLWALIVSIVSIQLLGWAKVNQLLIPLCSLQGILLFSLAGRRAGGKTGLQKALPILEGMGGATVVIGALFQLMAWPGHDPMLLVGTAAVLMGLGAKLFIAKPQDFFSDKPSQLRYVLLLSLGLFSLLMTTQQVAVFLFPGQEKVQEAFIELRENPQDTVALEKYWEVKKEADSLSKVNGK